MKLRPRVERLEQVFPPPTPEERQEQRRWRSVSDRLLRQLCDAFPVFADDPLVEAAVLEFLDYDRGPLAQWLDDLRKGWSRVPELSAEVMRQVVFCWLHPGSGDAMVCNHCGLECPRSDLRHLNGWRDPHRDQRAERARQEGWPRYFEACPCCGASTRDADWPHLIEGKNPPWKALDGWLGAGRAKR
jgi:hypothetical protein